MIRLAVNVEIQGESVHVGDIAGNDCQDACFTYAEEYLARSGGRAISISLPLSEKAFTAERTRNFFEGLLPEGFIRKCVAQLMRADESDYLAILGGLGNECLGAIRVFDNAAQQILPGYIKLSEAEVRALAQEGATESVQLVAKSHLSLTGASGKVGLYYNEKEGQWYFPVGEAPSTHIVKQSHVRLKKIVANEQLCLLTAQNLGLEVPESFIVSLEDNDGENVLFATKRYDREIGAQHKIISGLPVPYRLHQEDFAQALGIASAAKYEKRQEGYLQKMFELLRAYSANPVADQLKLWDICLFNYFAGNTDSHIKNFSLLYSGDFKHIKLAPAYDLVSTMIYDGSTDEMAFSIGGKYSVHKIGREEFAKEAVNVGLGGKLAMARFDNMAQNFVKALLQAQEILQRQGFNEAEAIGEKILNSGGIKYYR